MRIERVRIGEKTFYFVDGEKIRTDALASIISGVYGADVCAKIYHDAVANGYAIVERYTGDGNEQLIAKLEEANKKIAALEKHVAQLTMKNIYLTA